MLRIAIFAISAQYCVTSCDTIKRKKMMNPSRRRPTCRVYIGGLPTDTRVKDIERFFKNYTRRIDILLKRGFAFIVSNFFFKAWLD